MYRAELDKHIRSSTLSNSFILFGESSFLIDIYTLRLTDIQDTSVLKLYYDEYDFTSAKAHLSQASLFGDRNVLIVKSEKKIPKKDLDTLIGACEKNRDNIFVYAYYGSDHKAYAKAPSGTNTMCVRFFHPNHSESISIVQAQARKNGVNIDTGTITHLLCIHNGDIALACNEIEKLKLYDRTITSKDIDALVYGLAEVNLEELIKKLLGKKDFRDDLKNILEHGEDEIRILTAVTSFITQLYMFNIYIRTNGTVNAMDILGYNAPKFVADEKAGMALRLKPQIFFKMHELLLDAELKMKNSHVEKDAVLLSTLLRFQQLL